MNTVEVVIVLFIAAYVAYICFRKIGLRALMEKSPEYYRLIGSPPLVGRDILFLFFMIRLPKNVLASRDVINIRLTQLFGMLSIALLVYAGFIIANMATNSVR